MSLYDPDDDRRRRHRRSRPKNDERYDREDEPQHARRTR
jgi:hypothetical protein